jgi:hypothetical protein
MGIRSNFRKTVDKIVTQKPVRAVILADLPPSSVIYGITHSVTYRKAKETTLIGRRISAHSFTSFSTLYTLIIVNSPKNASKICARETAKKYDYTRPPLTRGLSREQRDWGREHLKVQEMP